MGFELTTFVVFGTDCLGSCISSYHMITTMTAPNIYQGFVKLASMPSIYHYIFTDSNQWYVCIVLVA